MENKKVNDYNLPTVTICTPTFNRRPFIPGIIRCVENQQYPKDLIEWVIIDDGTDKIQDLVSDLSYVKYFKYDTKMSLGEKRNIMHEKSGGDILVYMDDDDYYPPTRVSHAVQKLQENPDILCAGCSTIYVWFHHITSMVKFGPYHEKHATAGTFAFKKELLNTSHYDSKLFISEEQSFLKNYTIPIIQLDPVHVILCFSHRHNTFDKSKLLPQMESSPHIALSDKKPEYFINETIQYDFYINKLDDMLSRYDKGMSIHKPDVLLQMLENEETRRLNLERKISEYKFCITIKQPGADNLILYEDQIISLIQTQHSKNQTQNDLINTLMEKNKDLEESLLKQNALISRLQSEYKSEDDHLKNITFEINDS